MTSHPDGDIVLIRSISTKVDAARPERAAMPPTPPRPVPRKPLPMNTPLAKFGFAPEELKQLSPGAQKLTKNDLVALMTGEVPPAAQALTLRDLHGITQVYAMRAKAGTTTSGGGGCCCCCIACCCCCTAVSVDPLCVTVAA